MLVLCPVLSNQKPGDHTTGVEDCAPRDTRGASPKWNTGQQQVQCGKLERQYLGTSLGETGKILLIDPSDRLNIRQFGRYVSHGAACWRPTVPAQVVLRSNRSLPAMICSLSP